MGCTPLDEQQPGSLKEARAEELVRRRVAHDYWFQLILVLLYVGDDAGALQTLMLMYRSCCLKRTSVLCSRSLLRYVSHNCQPS